jgi:hypothetical protein
VEGDRGEGGGMMEPDPIIDVWLALATKMLTKGAEANTLRPPSLRDACYAYALSVRSKADTTPETIEAFVNGLELGCIFALRRAWNRNLQ